jgi:hypothetical protein
MAIKHTLSKFVCAWAGHDRVPGTTNVYGTPYYCECCSRCHKVLARDSVSLAFRLREMEFRK